MSQSPDTTQTTSAKRRHWQIPHIYVILFVFIAIAAVATHFVPAGEYERIPGPNGRITIDAESFQFVEPNPTGIVDFMLAIPNGLMSAGEVVFFTFMIGGMFMVLRRTGIIEIGVDKLSRQFAGRSLLMIPVLMTVFAVVATIIGTQELALVYVPVILPLMIALRFDSVTAAAVALHHRSPPAFSTRSTLGLGSNSPTCRSTPASACGPPPSWSCSAPASTSSCAMPARSRPLPSRA